MKPQVKTARQAFAPGTSRIPQRPHIFAVQMAMEIERRHEMAGRIRALRGPKPQPVIAQAVGVGLRTYQTWEEAATSPNWENLQALASQFKVSEDYLLYGEAEPRGPESQLDRIETQIGEIREVLDQLLAAGFQREIEQADDQAPPREPGTAASDAESAGTGGA